MPPASALNLHDAGGIQGKVTNLQPNMKGLPISTLSLLAEPSFRNGLVSILPHEITTSRYSVKEVRANRLGGEGPTFVWHCFMHVQADALLIFVALLFRKLEEDHNVAFCGSLQQVLWIAGPCVIVPASS